MIPLITTLAFAGIAMTMAGTTTMAHSLLSDLRALLRYDNGRNSGALYRTRTLDTLKIPSCVRARARA